MNSPGDLRAIVATRGTGRRQLFRAPIARLKPGVSFTQAQAVLTGQGDQLKESRRPLLVGHPELLKRLREERYIALAANQVKLPFDPFGRVVPARLATALMVVVGVVMLIAVANIAAMLMARSATFAHS